VEAELGDRIALILDGGPCEIGIESTVVLLETSGDIRLLRPGGVTRKELEQTIGAPILDPPRQGDTGATPLPSPGLLASHYAPRKPLAITTLPELEALSSESLARTGVILAAGPAPHFTWSPGRLVVLSPSGDLAIAAQRLFAALRALDEDVAVDRLLATLCADESGLGFAINDRLRKASHA
jgi:L-threonylcarbamoyladenylate synthase